MFSHHGPELTAVAEVVPVENGNAVTGVSVVVVLIGRAGAGEGVGAGEGEVKGGEKGEED